MAPKKAPDCGISLAEARELKGRFPLFEIRAPYQNETSRSQPRDELCIHLDSLKAGMTLPLQGELVHFLRHFRMVPAMLTPNTVAVLLGLHRFFRTCSIEWTIANIMSLLTFTSKTPGIYYAQVRSGLTFGITNCPAYSHGWDRRFAFFKPIGQQWGIMTQVPEPNVAVFKKFTVSPTVSELYLGYNEPFFCLDLRTNSISFDRDGKKKVADDKKGKEAPEVLEGVMVVAEEEDNTVVVPRVQPSRAGKRQRIEESPERPILYLEGLNTEAAARPSEEHVPLPTEVPTAGEGPSDTATVNIPLNLTREFEIEVVTDRGFYVDKEENVLVTKFDDSRRFVPNLDLTDVPSVMVSSLSCPADREAMKKMSDEALRHLQTQLAFGSSMVTQFISEKAEKRGSIARCFRSANRQLVAENTKLIEGGKLLEGEIEKLGLKLNQAKAVEEEKLKKQMEEEKLNLAKAVADSEAKFLKGEETLKAEKILLEKQVLDLKCAMAEELAAHAKERLRLSEEKAVATERSRILRSELTLMSVQKKEWEDKVKVLLDAAPAISQSAEEVIEKYKESDEYSVEMSNTSEDAFRILKDALLFDGVLSKEVLDKYDFDTCLNRDADGEFSIPPPM